MPVGKGRSKGCLVLPKRQRCSDVLDFMMFSLLIPIVGMALDKNECVSAGPLLAFTYHFVVRYLRADSMYLDLPYSY